MQRSKSHVMIVDREINIVRWWKRKGGVVFELYSIIGSRNLRLRDCNYIVGVNRGVCKSGAVRADWRCL